MNKPSEADLLGYLLGALDAHEQQAVEAAISRDDSVRQELERLETTLASVEMPDEDDARPPVGLARRTCNLVAALDCGERENHKQASSNQSPQKTQAKLSPASADLYSGRKTGWSMVDILVTACVCALIGMIFLPALANSRFQADVRGCQNNLRQIGMGLQNYADNYSGRLIPIPVSRELGVAGVYASRLDDMELVDDTSVFFCPSLWRNVVTEDGTHQRRIPKWTELLNAERDEVYRLRQDAGGDYAYTLGCYDGEKYCQPEVTNCSNTVILGDVPDSAQPGFRSLNHGGRGQNVLLGDFSTKYLMSCMASPGDNFYQNDQGIIAAGMSPADSVLGASSASPFVDLSRKR